MKLILNVGEMAALYKQDPTRKDDGGWQSLIVGLQEACDQATGEVSVTLEQREKIRRYAFKYSNGGWENRLKAAFGNHLGSNLDLGLGAPNW